MISFNTQATSQKLNTNPKQSLVNGGSVGVLSTPNASRTAGMGLTVGNNPGVIPQPKPTTPVKKITQPDGSTVEYHAEQVPKTSTPTQAKDVKAGATITDTNGNQGVAQFDPMTGQKYATPTPPVSSSNPNEQIQNVGQAGQQTGNEATTFNGLVGQSQNSSQDYKDAQNKYAESVKALADYKANLAATNRNISAEGISLDSSRGQNANIGQAAASTLAALQGAVTEQEQALGYANTQQGLQVQAGGLANTAAQTQAQRGLSAQGTVLNAGLLSPTSIGQVPFSAVTGAQGQMIGGQGGLSQLGALQQQQNQGSQTQTMIGAYNQSKPLIETAKQQIESAGFNNNPLALANQLQQYVNKGVAPSAEYANIFNTLSEIATTISPVLGAQGAQTDLKTMISQEFIPKLLQGSQISSVLDNIEKNALAKIEANKATAQGAPLTVPTSGSSTGGSIWNF